MNNSTVRARATRQRGRPRGGPRGSGRGGNPGGIAQVGAQGLGQQEPGERLNTGTATPATFQLSTLASSKCQRQSPT